MSTTVTSTPISDFFLRLADDPELLAEYGRDARGAMAAAGLTAEQMSILMDDAKRLRSAVDEELAADPMRRHLIVTPRMTTHTGPEPEPPTEPEPPQPPTPQPPPQPPPPEPPSGE